MNGVNSESFESQIFFFSLVSSLILAGCGDNTGSIVDRTERFGNYGGRVYALR